MPKFTLAHSMSECIRSVKVPILMETKAIKIAFKI
jgi:hypothetical protein